MSFTSLEFFQVHQELLIGWSMGGRERPDGGHHGGRWQAEARCGVKPGTPANLSTGLP